MTPASFLISHPVTGKTTPLWLIRKELDDAARTTQLALALQPVQLVPPPVVKP